MRKIVRLLTLALGLAISLVVAPSAGQAAPVDSACLATQNQTESEQDRNSTLNLLVAGIRQQGQSQQAIDARLGDQFGLRRVSSAPAPVAPMTTTPSHINISAPEIFYDRCTGRYTVFAKWNFTNMTAIYQDVVTNCSRTCPIGGYDGFGVALNRSVDPGGNSLTTWGQTSYYPPRTTERIQ